MEEKTLLKIALVASLAGLMFLYLISSNIEIKEKNIEKITLENKDEFVKLRGIVSNLVNSEKVAILEITQPQEITVVLFKNENKTMPIQKGNDVEIFGKVDEYKGKMDNVDSYMNLIMTDAEEFHDGKVIANYGRVIVRGNNVLFIKLENEL